MARSPYFCIFLVFFMIFGEFTSPAQTYLAVLSSNLPPGTVVFEAGVPNLGGKRKYIASQDRTAWFALKLLKVHPHNGKVTLIKSLSCDGLQYPRLFTFYIDSTSSRLGRATIDYYSLPLRILVTGCGGEDVDLMTTNSWMAETLASYAMPSTEKVSEVCLRTSQLVVALRDFLPHTALQQCETRWGGVADPRFLVEGAAGDLVSASEQCLVDSLWKISVSMNLRCGTSFLTDSEHRLKIVFHHQQLDDTDLGRRVRRELRNGSPVFEQALYVAAIEEEKEPGLSVTIVKARDPEGGIVRYSMSSLIDARSQSLFNLDPSSGKVTTTAQLNRESVDQHYFRILGVDDSFPPRTGTTTLQINVLDVNDHAPVFESPEYDATVHESVPIGSSVIGIKATDQDVGKNAEIEYSIFSTTGGGTTTLTEDQSTFRIDTRTGIVTTRRSLDRERTEVYTIIIQASDMANSVTDRHTASTSLVVRVLDDNDNYPQFSERTYMITIPEDLDYTMNPKIAEIRATDIDTGFNAAIRYGIIGGNIQNTFQIDSASGDMILVKTLDYESVKNYKIIIRAQDGGLPAKSNTTQLLVRIKDVNDNIPRFHTSFFEEDVSESVSIGYSILKVQAFDADEGLNALIRYSIGSRDLSGGSTHDIPVTINPETGWLRTIKLLDREQFSKYQFIVIAKDSGEPQLAASATVMLTVTDINDNDPYFDPKSYEAVVAENDPPGTAVTIVTATDADEDTRIHYDITSGNTRGRFSITSQNGRGLITISQLLDYKQEKRYVLTVMASDSGGRTDTAVVYVNVSDANNYAPVFENAPYSVSIFEDAPIGTTVLVISALDADVGLNAQITYSLGSETDAIEGHEILEFVINPQTGAITTKKALDREKISGYLLTVTAKDGGVPPMTDTTDVEISVTDVNDNPPYFDAQQYQGAVREDVLIGTSVLKVTATDFDEGLNGRVKYTLENNGDSSFSIDATTGIIRTAKALDRESTATFTLKALAIDKGFPSLSSTVLVNIKVEDVNDSPPVFPKDVNELFILENSPIGSSVGEIYASDADEGSNAIVEYAIIGGEDAQSFQLNTWPGADRAELISLVEMDYESAKKKFTLIIRATSAPLRTDAVYEVYVKDVNDNSPKLEDFQIIFNNFKNYFPSESIGRVPAFDADVTDSLSYTILSGNNANLVDLNSTTGAISLSPQLNTNVHRVATLEVSVTDGINVVKANMILSVIMVTEKMLLSSITVRLEEMTVEAFLSPLLGYFLDGLAAIIPCPKENIYIFSIQPDVDIRRNILNVSFSAKKIEPGTHEEFYSSQFLQERVYLNRGILARLANVKILPFDDNLCVSEPCLNFEKCITVLKFGNATGFASSSTVLFRPIIPVTTFTCQCPRGFIGHSKAFLCDTELNLCFSNPCKNGGTCRRREGGYSCECPISFIGQNCQISMEKNSCELNFCKGNSQCITKVQGGFFCNNCPIRPLENVTPMCQLKSRSFGPATYLTFPSLKQRHRLHLKLKFATESSDGLLIYNGRYNEKHDFIALEIVESKIHFSFSLGKEVTKVMAEIPGGVSDGNWHEVQVSYFNKSAVVSIDNCDVSLALRFSERLGDNWSCAGRNENVLESRCHDNIETCHRFLDLTGPLQLGGLPTIPSNFQIINKDFVGCISEFFIDYQFVDLNSFIADNGTTPGCPEKRSFCESDPCLNSGICHEVWAGYICECKEGWGGPECNEKIGRPWNFHGSGYLSFNPLLKPILLPWFTGFSLRTREKNAFIMTIQIGQNNSIFFELKEGKFVILLDNIYIIKSRTYVSDGNWHRIEVLWQSGKIELDFDYRKKPLVLMLPAKLQGLYIGRMFIGGSDRSFSVKLPFFNGCIQDVRIGSNSTTLDRPMILENVDYGCESDGICRASCIDEAKCIVGWEHSECICTEGRIGIDCEKICDVNPCSDSGTCVEKPHTQRGYECLCHSSEYSGEYCELKSDQPCPATWWGSPVCGPCHCEEALGYDQACNQTTGECYCKENHYQLPGKKGCIPCDCYATGSFGPKCDQISGQCRCRTGVVGRDCTACPNSYAEVTTKGCEVVYDGCPRSFSEGLWWSRTKFGETAFEDCPDGSIGKASRPCSDILNGWQSADLFNCTSDTFIELRHQLEAYERKELFFNSNIAIKISTELRFAVNITKKLYGADLYIAEFLLTALLSYEESLAGLNLTHSQDKDYVGNLIGVAGEILQKKYSRHWDSIKSLTWNRGQEHSPERVMLSLAEYLKTLAVSQHDTYTSPFEVVHPKIVLGLDIVTSESIYEEWTGDVSSLSNKSFNFSELNHNSGRSILFPKYNNYMPDPNKFDQLTKVEVPLSLLGIKPVVQENFSLKNSLVNHKAVLGYVQYKELNFLLPIDSFDDTVSTRFGVDLVIASSIVTVSVLVPTTAGYETLTGIILSTPIRIQMWISDNGGNKTRINPQCVHWSNSRGAGEWSTAGCKTEVADGNLSIGRVINCSCLKLSTFAVLMDELKLEYVPEPSFFENVTSYSAFIIALPMLFFTIIILTLIRGSYTNSNSIHKNLILSVFLSELLYCIALKARNFLIKNEFSCRLIAIGLHYTWLCTFSWTLIDSLHLFRMLTEIRDINHGEMGFYYTIGYVVPAIIVALTMGLNADQYGNIFFCWLSIYESVIWSLIGPICLSVLINFGILVMSVRAAFTLKEHVMGFGNLRTLLWLSIGSLPLIGATWALAVLAASENSPTLSYMLSVSVITHATFSIVGYCFINSRVRRNFYLSLLKCIGSKAPLVDTSKIDESSSHNVTSNATRGRIAYSPTYGEIDLNSRRVHIGVSMSSETSQSTNKTTSSPYRSDIQPRNPSTLPTSNFSSDCLNKMPQRLSQAVRHRRHQELKKGHVKDLQRHVKLGHRYKRESDTDSEINSRGLALELVSSQSSNEDDDDDDDDDDDQLSVAPSIKRQQKNVGVTTQFPNQNINLHYVPNITSGNKATIESLDYVRSVSTDLFPNIKPMYAPRWSSQLPEANIFNPINTNARISQWSGGTISDNEIGSSNTIGQNPLTYMELNLRQPQLISKLYHPDANFTENDEKLHIADEFLCPYSTVEKEIITHNTSVSPMPYLLSTPFRILNSSLSPHSQTKNQDYCGDPLERHSLQFGDTYHRSYHENLNRSLERYGSLKRGKLTFLVDKTDNTMNVHDGGIMSTSGMPEVMQHFNEITNIQHQYENTIQETKKDCSDVETPV